ncbi:hypothetical protein SynBIOSE41_02918 [Synechococcus sp. BIOS-E4-1]|nr:hypothetical protein SynBIOSE41_02918 [Synechococcus sp. BIOS-E4-1]
MVWIIIGQRNGRTNTRATKIKSEERVERSRAESSVRKH